MYRMWPSLGGLDDIKTKVNRMFLLVNALVCTFVVLMKGALVLAGTVIGAFVFLLVVGTLIAELVAAADA